MRKAKFRMVLAGLFAAFGLMFLAQQGQAQSSITSFGAAAHPKGGSAPINYVSSPEAMTILDGQTADLKTVLSTLVPGTQAYKTVETSFTYYTMIMSGVASGYNVENSIIQGYSLFQHPDYLNTPSAQVQGLYDEAIDLLSN